MIVEVLVALATSARELVARCLRDRAPLARLELNVALEELLGQHPRFEMAQTGTARRAVYPANGWVNLPIAFD